MLLCLNANAASSPLLTPGTFLQTGNVCAGPDDDDDDKERDCHIDVCDKVCVCVLHCVTPAGQRDSNRRLCGAKNPMRHNFSVHFCQTNICP